MTNNEAMGYATIALYNILKNTNRSFDDIKESIQKLRNEMYYQFDMKTEDEAEEIGDIIKSSESKVALIMKLEAYYKSQPVSVIRAVRIK